MEEDTIFTFDSPKGQSSYIKVIGVGGGGGNAVNHMYQQGIKGVDFIVCNTDMKALNSSPVPNKITLGDLGLGAGNKPERARQAALDKADDIREAISNNTQMLFITAGMGGGTGTGAAPVIAEIAKGIDLDNDDNKKILVVAIVTLPFRFEGRRRNEQAQEGIKELSKHVDSIIVINNEKLRSFGNLTMSQSFAMADDVLLTAAKSIAEIITNNAYINIDFQDVNTVMEHSGTALMGAGTGRGENRAIDAITAATTSVLLDDNDIKGAKNVLLYFSYSNDHEITMDEQAEITDFILDKTGGDADFIWGAGTDDSLGDELKVILIATGFEKNVIVPEAPKVIELPVDEKPEPRVETLKPAADEPTLITKQEPVQQPVQQPVQKVEQQPVLQPQQPVQQLQQPVQQLQQQPVQDVAPVTPQRNVYVLEDEEPKSEMVQRYPETNQADRMVNEISVMTPITEAPATQTQAPVAKQETAQAQPRSIGESLAHSALSGNIDERFTRDRAERIRFIHDQLRNNPNGAEVVQQMIAQENGEERYEGNHSSTRESSAYSMRPNGSMVRNAFFGDNPD